MQSLPQSQQPSIRADPSLSLNILRSFLRPSIRFAPFFLLQENTILLYRNCCHHLLSRTIKSGVWHSSRMVLWSAICLSLGNKTNTKIKGNFNINSFLQSRDWQMPRICSLSRYLNTASDFARNYTGSPIPSGLRGGGIPYNGLHGKVVLKRGTFFRLQVCERVKESVISVCKRAQMGYPIYFMALNSSWKRSGNSLWKRSGYRRSIFFTFFSLSLLASPRKDQVTVLIYN